MPREMVCRKLGHCARSDTINADTDRTGVQALTINTVIFDLWGTLIETFPPVGFDESMHDVAAILGVSADTISSYRRRQERARLGGELPTVEALMDHMCQALQVLLTAEQKQRAIDLQLSPFVRALDPSPSTLDTLTTLQNQGLRLGLISVCSADIPHVWPGNPLAPFLSAPVFSGVHGVSKPEPQAYLLACEHLDTTPDGCLYIDDQPDFVAGAQAVGMRGVLLADGLDRPDWTGERVRDVADLLTLLSQ